MFCFKVHNIYDVAKPLHICSQTIGLTCFSIKQKGNVFVYRVTVLNVLCVSLMTFGTLLMIFLYAFYAHQIFSFNRTHISELFENCIFYLLILFQLTTVIVNWTLIAAKFHFAKALTLLKEIDEELETLKLPINLGKHRNVILCFAIIMKSFTLISLYVTTLIGTKTQLYEVNIFMLIAMSFSMEIAVFTIFHFTFWMWAVKLRYQRINQYLKEQFLTFVGETGEDGVVVLNKAAILHDKLVDVTECINRCYGFPVRLKNKLFKNL